MTYPTSTDPSMGNYPPGAAHDPRAPYNRDDPEEELFGVTVTYHISRTADVATTDYDGQHMLQPMDDYEHTYLDPVQLLGFAVRSAEHMLATHDYAVASPYRLRKVISSAIGWDTDWKEIDKA